MGQMMKWRCLLQMAEWIVSRTDEGVEGFRDRGDSSPDNIRSPVGIRPRPAIYDIHMYNSRYNRRIRNKTTKTIGIIGQLRNNIKNYKNN